MEPYKAKIVCMMCGYERVEVYAPDKDQEMVCPRCGSNSIRIKKVQ